MFITINNPFLPIAIKQRSILPAFGIFCAKILYAIKFLIAFAYFSKKVRPNLNYEIWNNQPRVFYGKNNIGLILLIR